MHRAEGSRTGDLVSIPRALRDRLARGLGAAGGRTERTEAAEERAVRAERERESAARVAVAEERTRIARELHDVVAHAVSVMVLQVGAVRHRMPESARRTARRCGTSSRPAAPRSRRCAACSARCATTATTRSSHPTPGWTTSTALVDDVRAAGLEVRVGCAASPTTLPPGLDLSAYRIVQEALTNSLKHATPGPRRRGHRASTGPLRLEVRDDGPRDPGAADGLGTATA